MWLQVPFTTVHSGETPSSHQETTNTLPFRWPWSLVGRTSHAISCVWMLSERELGQTSLILKKNMYIELYRYKYHMILSWTIQFSSLCFSRIWGNFWLTSFFKRFSMHPVTLRPAKIVQVWVRWFPETFARRRFPTKVSWRVSPEKANLPARTSTISFKGGCLNSSVWSTNQEIASEKIVTFVGNSTGFFQDWMSWDTPWKCSSWFED